MMAAELAGTLKRIERKLDLLHKKVEALKRPERTAAQRFLAHCRTIKVSGPPGPKLR